MSQVKTLLLGFSTDTSGELIMIVGRKNVIDRDATPIKLFHGDAVKTIYKELSDEELTFDDSAQVDGYCIGVDLALGPDKTIYPETERENKNDTY